MQTIISLVIGDQTFSLWKKSVRSIRAFHPDIPIMVFHALGEKSNEIVDYAQSLNVKCVDISQAGILPSLAKDAYSLYNTSEFNLKTSFKWIALLTAIEQQSNQYVMFIDADIVLCRPLPLAELAKILDYYDIFVQDEGDNIFPKHPCTGFMGFKCTHDNKQFIAQLHKEHCASLISGQSIHDQTIFMRVISSNIETYRKVYFLSQLLFPVGYMLPVYGMTAGSPAETVNVPSPVLFHANWTIGIDNKLRLMTLFE